MRYPDRFKQDLPEEWYAELPKFCRYEGDAEDLIYLRGLLIPTKEVERLVYVGERENIYVYMQDGRARPWMSVAIVDIEDTLAPSVEPLPSAVHRGLGRYELAELGFTEAELVALAHDVGVRVPASTLLNDAERRRVFDAVMRKLHG